MTQPVPNVVVIVKQGTVQEVLSDEPVCVTVIDFDVEGVPIGDDEAAVEEFRLPPDPQRVAAYLRQVKAG